MDDLGDVGNNETGQEAEPSALSDEALYISMKSWFLSDSAHSSDWREQARKDFDFYAGEQWDPETKKTMEGEGRVPITFNQTLPLIKAVAGIEINTRHQTVYLPRGTEEGDIIANEGLTQASNWMADGCNAKREESQAFQDALKCGMGWVEERLDYEDDPDGKYIESHFSPLEAYWDGAARGVNIQDSRRRWRARKMPIADARAKFPDVDDADLNCSWAMGVETKPLQAAEDRRLKQDNNGKIDDRSMVTILQVQWWEREKYHRVANPITGEVESLDKKKFDELSSRIKELEDDTGQAYPLEYVEQTRKVFKQAFVGGKVLKKGPCPRKDGFTLHCVTGELNLSKGTYFGLITMLRDPQMMSNKWLSQATHIINTTAKGGIMAEQDAFVDVKEAQANWARPDAITLLKKGAIGGNKIMAKPGVGLASTYFQLIQFAVEAMPRVTGINMELMGLRDINQPGILEAQRKQAAMTILATLFDALMDFRTEVGKTRLHFIQNYLADGRLIRLIGEDGKGYRAVKLMKDRVVGEYDVVVDEAPTSPNQKEVTWAALKEVIPAFQGLISPQLAVKLLKYVPGLPKELIDDFQAVMDQPNPDQEKQKQLAYAGGEAKVVRDQAAAEKDFATAEKIKGEAILNMGAQIGQSIDQAAKKANAVGAIARATKTIMPPAPTEEFAVQPMDQGMPQLPTPPMPRTGPLEPTQGE
jgi:hypothetical protein